MGALQVEREGATGGGATPGPRRGAPAVLACPEGYVGAQSSPRVARESWGWRSSHCRA